MSKQGPQSSSDDLISSSYGLPFADYDSVLSKVDGDILNDNISEYHHNNSIFKFAPLSPNTSSNSYLISSLISPKNDIKDKPFFHNRSLSAIFTSSSSNNK